MSQPGFGRLWAGSVVIPVIWFALSGLWAWQSVTADQTGEAERTVRMVYQQTLRALETQGTVIEALQSYSRTMTWDEIRRSAAMHDFAQRLVAATPAVSRASIVDPAGFLATTSVAQNTPEVLAEHPISMAGRDFVRAYPAGTAKRGTHVGAVVASRDGQTYTHLSRPRLGAEGVPDGGVIVAAFAPANFELFFAEVAQTGSTGFMLLREDGMVLARYPGHVTAGTGAISPNDRLRAAMRDMPANGDVLVLREGSLLGGLRLVALRRVEGYPLFVIHSTDAAVLRNAWLTDMAPAAVISLAAMALLLALTARAQNRMLTERAQLLSRTAHAEEGQARAQDRAELEARLRQTEKVAALGQIAAGVAHDFNNLLQSMLLHADVLEQMRGVPDAVRSGAAVIVKACLRGQDLTRRMLDHARGEGVEVTDINTSAALQSAQELLTRSLGGQHRLRLETESDELPSVRGSAAELESVLINLVANARDAMPAGGEIRLEAHTLQLPYGEGDARTRSYLQIAVRDTGHGMDEATLARAGEAFFTTKERGKGTGLGLSMARGFAERAGGSMTLQSERGRGTTVVLLLPVAEHTPHAQPALGK
jgi:two-component system, NtrC family, sensor kinase